MDKKYEDIDVKVKEELLKKTLPSNSKSVFRKKILNLLAGAKLFISVVCSWSLLELQVCLPLKTSDFPWKLQ